jgi:hypothetical protein
LPHIRSLLGISGAMQNSAPPLGASGSSDTSFGLANWQAVLSKHDQIYKHNIMHINYTVYDVHHDEDVIHAGTSRQCNIMVLTPETAGIRPPDQHPFWYTCVLGVYHANVIYIGEGNVNYLPCQLEFLWVRWYEWEDHDAGWSS